MARVNVNDIEKMDNLSKNLLKVPEEAHQMRKSCEVQKNKAISQIEKASGELINLYRSLDRSSSNYKSYEKMIQNKLDILKRSKSNLNRSYSDYLKSVEEKRSRLYNLSHQASKKIGRASKKLKEYNKVSTFNTYKFTNVLKKVDMEKVKSEFYGSLIMLGMLGSTLNFTATQLQNPTSLNSNFFGTQSEVELSFAAEEMEKRKSEMKKYAELYYKDKVQIRLLD